MLTLTVPSCGIAIEIECTAADHIARDSSRFCKVFEYDYFTEKVDAS